MGERVGGGTEEVLRRDLPVPELAELPVCALEGWGLGVGWA